MPKIYVGCSLTHATQEFRDSIEYLKTHIGEKYHLLSFLGFGAGTAKEIFDYDVDCVNKADFMVADCTYPSTGLGMELGIAYTRKIPVLLIARTDANVALMVQGLPNRYKDIVRYENILDIVGEIDEMIRSVK
jgi:nucleoside 2-deoxyribosyltransferase